MAYKPFPSEPDVLSVLHGLGARDIYFPLLRGNGLLAQKALDKRGKRMCHSHLRHPHFLPLSKIDVLIVPALFVQKNGYRIGRGGGFYDRLLRFFLNKKVIFLGYDWQIMADFSWEWEKHDRRVTTIITNSQIIHC